MLPHRPAARHRAARSGVAARRTRPAGPRRGTGAGFVQRDDGIQLAGSAGAMRARMASNASTGESAWRAKRPARVVRLEGHGHAGLRSGAFPRPLARKGRGGAAGVGQGPPTRPRGKESEEFRRRRARPSAASAAIRATTSPADLNPVEQPDALPGPDIAANIASYRAERIDGLPAISATISSFGVPAASAATMGPAWQATQARGRACPASA